MLQDQPPLIPPAPATTGPTHPPHRRRSRAVKVGCAVTLAAALLLVVCLGLTAITLHATKALSRSALGPPPLLNRMPAWSPDGKQIAFSSNQDGNTDIYVMDADGSHLIQLTQDSLATFYFLQSATDVEPAWSPDGQHLLFTSGRGNKMMSYVDLDIYVMRPDGTQVTPLTNLPAILGVQQEPAWSPDGQQIAFTSDTTGRLGLYVMNADGSNIRALRTDMPDSGQAAWSPDGTQLAFASDYGGNADIYKIDQDGSNAVRLTSDKADDLQPDWSPDGSQIVFASKRSGNYDLYLMNTDGTGLIALTNSPANETQPAWSPDGTQLAYVSDAGGDSNIYVMNKDGSDVVQLTGNQTNCFVFCP